MLAHVRDLDRPEFARCESFLEGRFQHGVRQIGKRFLFVTPAAQGADPFSVVLNWQAGLKK